MVEPERRPCYPAGAAGNRLRPNSFRWRGSTIAPILRDASALAEEAAMRQWKTIVVGVDGSPGSRKALTWAAAEANHHMADLVVLNVWEHTLMPPAGSVS